LTARFVIDAQLPPALAVHLAARGFLAEHVNRIGLREAHDVSIWEYARRHDATLITKDEDFVALARREESGPQVVWIRCGNIANDPLWAALSAVLDEVLAAIEIGERIVEVR
jgi:predicted nuclease of predicted toxin-antitoxin system